MATVYLDQSHNGSYFRACPAKSGQTVLQVLKEMDIDISGASCNGAGICRGCMVYVCEEETEQLACRLIVGDSDLHIRLSETEKKPIRLTGEPIVEPPNSEAKFGFAVDIGTTTIAAALTDLESGRIYWERGTMNRQASFGADVISRIGKALDSKNLKKLSDDVTTDIEELYSACLADGFDEEKIDSIVIAGNTTMLHFLLNTSVSGLAGFPFTPEFLEAKRFTLFEKNAETLPCLSAFVGADIVSGLNYLRRKEDTTGINMLIDLGTNGEIVLWDENRCFATSTACGPAFANSVSGNGLESSLIDAIADSLNEGQIQPDGALNEIYSQSGLTKNGFWITQSGIRQIQLAKAAILTGIELLAYEMRISPEEIDHVFLAGGFGFALNAESAFRIKLLPEAFRGKIKTVGNTSLLGACMACGNKEFFSLQPPFDQANVLDLSNSKNFQEFFLKRLDF